MRRMASPPPLSSLRLLIPPLRLLTAAMWQVARRQSMKNLVMLEDFVSLVTETVPQLLTERQKSLLLVALRAKVALSDADPQAVQAHFGKIHSVSEQPDEEVDKCWAALLNLNKKLTECPADRQRLLEEVFNYSFDSALQSLISDFLYKIEQLFPVPDFKQAAFWLETAPGVVDDSMQEVDREDLRELLTSQSYSQEQAVATVDQNTENVLLSAWSHPLLTKLTNPDSPTTSREVQSDPFPDMVPPVHLGVELVEEEVVVALNEEELEEVEEAVIGQVMSPVDQEASEVGGDEGAVNMEVDRSEDKFAVQSEDIGNQSHQSCSEVLAEPLYSMSHNSQRVAHKCPRCGKCFIYRSQVIRHLRTNKLCAPTSTVAENVPVQLKPGLQEEPPAQESHLLEPHPLKTHTCFQCDTTFRTDSELLTHQRSHRTRTVYQCDLCKKKFHHLASLSNHKQAHLGKSGFTCSRGEKEIKSKEPRAARLQPQLMCTVCHQTFSSQKLLLRHLQTHSAEGVEPCYSCRFCDQTFSGVTQLRIHQRTHTFRAYKCDQCSKMYSSLTGLNSHRASHINESRFLCPQCGKCFKTRDGLEGHLRRHAGERPYRCPHCPKDFTALAGLNVHVRRHTGERPYVCTICSKGWPSGGDLQKHMRTHTGERPYVCENCGKAFTLSCHLTEHRRIHTGEKPYSCPECGKCLRRKFDLKKHMLSHSSVRPYTCMYCSKSYTRKTHLNRHLLTHKSANSQEAIAEMV
ncbi:zinc finger protein 271-like isoform X1 [Takifugu flavidus]|uniref:zinc finger protein 271-like isoform X1 n=1 Tax=Takifugu flavidus TaxID=433684 RepID=UPI0025449824|nr:zinc finger protein 271-like isoform X1 [Takifugu flavidus]